MSELKLAEKFKSGGFEFEQVERNGDLAIFKMLNKTGRIVAYEAVRISHKRETKLPNGKIDPARECYPSPSSWGRTAWSCMTLERAKERLKSLAERDNTSILIKKPSNPPQSTTEGYSQ